MSAILHDILSCCDPTAPAPSRSHSRSSGGHAPRRSRSNRSPRYNDTRDGRPRHRSHSSGQRCPEDGTHNHAHSPKYTGGAQRGIPTTLVHRNRQTRPRQAERGPARRSTLPSNLESTKVQLPQRRHTESCSGFDPLANKNAYEGVSFLKETKHERAMNRGQRSSSRTVKRTQTQTPTMINEEVTGRDFWIDVRTDARGRPFKKLDDEFWDTQLTKEEQSVATEIFKNDFGSAYDVNLYPCLKGVMASLSGSQLTEAVKHKWDSIDAFRRRIHPHRVRSPSDWKQLLDDVTKGDENIGRYLAANHMTEDQLSQAQRACDAAGRPFWEMAALEHRQDLKSRVNSIFSGRHHDSHRSREAREMRLIEALQQEFRTALDPPDTYKSGPTM